MDWRPIRLAPKIDYRVRLGYWLKKPALIWWSAKKKTWIIQGWGAQARDGDVSHWMPIPDNPKRENV